MPPAIFAFVSPPALRFHPLCPSALLPHLNFAFSLRTSHPQTQQQPQLLTVLEAHGVKHESNDYIFLDLLERNEEKHWSHAARKSPLNECTPSCSEATLEEVREESKWAPSEDWEPLQSAGAVSDDTRAQNTMCEQKSQTTRQEDKVENCSDERLKVTKEWNTCCDQKIKMSCQEEQVHEERFDEQLTNIKGQEIEMSFQDQVQDTIVEKSPWQITQSVLQLAKNLPTNVTLSECLDSFSGHIDTECGNEILHTLGNGQHLLQALSFFEWMRVHTPCLLNSNSFCLIITILGRGKMVDRALTLFQNMPNGREFHCVTVYNALISALANNERHDEALLIVKEMATRSVEPDSITFSILITCASKNGHSLTAVWRIFGLMGDKRIRPSITVFGSLIKAFCNKGLRKEALLIAREMESRQGFPLNIVIYNTLIDAYGKAMLLEEAEGLVSEMRENGIRPSVSTYNSLIDAYGRQGRCEVAESLLLEMQAHRLSPDIISYSTLISAYGRQKLSEKAANVFLRMKKNGICPNTQSYTALIHAFSEGGWHEKAETAFEDMLREGLSPMPETYTALLDAYRQAGDLEKLMYYWKLMRKGNCTGTRVTFNVILDAFAKQGCYKEARDVMFEFAKLGFKPDRLTYNMLINAYTRGGQHAKVPDILMEMSAAGFSPDSFTFTTIIYAFLRVRDFTQAFRYHEQMCKHHQEPDRKTYFKLKALLDAKYAIKRERDQKSVLGQLQKQKGLHKKRGKAKRFWKRRKPIHRRP